MDEAAETINPWKLFYGAFVPNWLLMRSVQEISHGAKLTYARLCQQAGPGGIASIEQDEIGREIGVGERTVRRLIEELEELKLIRVLTDKIGGGNRYEFLKHPWIFDLPPDRPDRWHRTGLVKPTGQGSPVGHRTELTAAPDSSDRSHRTELTGVHNNERARVLESEKNKKEERAGKILDAAAPATGPNVSAVTPIAAPGVSKGTPNKYVQELRSEGKRSQEDMAKAREFVGAMDPMDIERLRRQYLSDKSEFIKKRFEDAEVLPNEALLAAVYQLALAEGGGNG